MILRAYVYITIIDKPSISSTLGKHQDVGKSSKDRVCIIIINTLIIVDTRRTASREGVFALLIL